MSESPRENVESLTVSPPHLARFLSKNDRDRSVVLLDVESFYSSQEPTILFNVVLNSIKLRRGAVMRADFHIATVGVELSVCPDGAEISDYTQSSVLNVEYQKEIARTASELSKAGGRLKLVGSEDRSIELSSTMENSVQNLIKGSASFVSTENQLSAVYRKSDLVWRLDPVSTPKAVRDFLHGNLWLSCRLDCEKESWSAEVEIRPTDIRVYGPDMLTPLPRLNALWLLCTMWAHGQNIRCKDGEVFSFQANPRADERTRE